jgi:branched-chain amino acid transport system permease protein
MLIVIANNVIAGLFLGGVLAVTALGLSLVLGVMRLVNLAHGEFLVLGAYLGLFLVTNFSIDPLLGLPLVAAVVGISAYPVQKFLISPIAEKGLEGPLMTTFGLSIILQNVFVIAFSGDTRSISASYAIAPLNFATLTVPRIYVIGFAIALIAFSLVHWLVTRTSFGRDLRASATDSAAAEVMGIEIRSLHAATFALGAGCAAVGGVLIGLIFSFTPSIGGAYLLVDFTIIVLGGLGNIWGTLIAGIAVGVLQGFGGAILGDGYRDLVGLVLFLIVLAIRPSGILSSSRLA